MNESLAIEHDRDALTRIVAALVAMAGLWGQFAFFPAEEAGHQGAARAERSKLSPPPHPEARAEGEPRRTLPRHLLYAVLRLLRPAEAAARRLIIALARGIAVTLPPNRRPGHASHPTIARFGARTATPEAATMADPPCPRPPPFPLLDPLRQPFSGQPWVKLAALPRISVPGITDRRPVPVRENPSPHDPMDATRLARRLQALSRALDDLPRQALRFARWQARRTSRPDGDPARRRWPLRLGRPPGWRRRRNHEVFDVLDHANQLAHFALEYPDSS